MRDPNHRLMVDTSPNQSHQQIDQPDECQTCFNEVTSAFAKCPVARCSMITCADCVSRFKDAGSGSATMTDTSRAIYDRLLMLWMSNKDDA